MTSTWRGPVLPQHTKAQYIAAAHWELQAAVARAKALALQVVKAAQEQTQAKAAATEAARLAEEKRLDGVQQSCLNNVF